MLVSLELTYFRRHESLVINFTKGLNALRGPNESGKSTLNEAIGYAGYGTIFLRNSLEKVVTWGHKVSEMRVKLVISMFGITYTFTRSKAGAECNWVEGGQPMKVTGQAPVSDKFAELMGADGKTAQALLMSSQDGLRLALEQGPTATAQLMVKMADFDQVDEIIELVSTHQSNGATEPIKQKIAAAETELALARAAVIDDSSIAELNAELVKLSAALTEAYARKQIAQAEHSKSEAAYIQATAQNDRRKAAMTEVRRVEQQVEATRARLAAAEEAAARRVPVEQMDTLRRRIAAAAEGARVAQQFALYLKLPTYPEVFWDEPRENFEQAFGELQNGYRASIEQLDDQFRTSMAALEADYMQKRGELVTQTNADFRVLHEALAEAKTAMQTAAASGTQAKLRLITTETCPVCGQRTVDHDHVVKNNAQVNAEIVEFARQANAANERAVATQAAIDEKTKASQAAGEKLKKDFEAAKLASATAYESKRRTLGAEYQAQFGPMSQIETSARERERLLGPIFSRVELDETVYPPRVTWRGEPPKAEPVQPLQSQLDALVSQDQEAQQMVGSAAAIRATLVEHEATLTAKREEMLAIPEVDLAPLQREYNAAANLLADINIAIDEAKVQVDDLRVSVETAQRNRQATLDRVAGAERRVIELQNDLADTLKGNTLLAKLKKIKPAITDYLWNRALVAVTNYFTQIRGTESTVTKAGSGFQVNGQDIDSLSGSTLDALALATRVALTKSFMPHVPFIVFDEPAHGADANRTAAMLAFLAGCGFEQVLLASHDEHTQTISDHVIELEA